MLTIIILLIQTTKANSHFGHPESQSGSSSIDFNPVTKALGRSKLQDNIGADEEKRLDSTIESMRKANTRGRAFSRYANANDRWRRAS
ncbi:hypothetical protein X777_06276 [Ooceraea biroi]|uniref:Uncharacterized protein n=1 Tax=Ooceraea biroi TaxID=2015173 RepID=A0A026WAS6_OOCBI|nr:hypothetical protein X777_06276 [Ooceraea biroi]